MNKWIVTTMLACQAALSQQAFALDEEHRNLAVEATKNGIAFLRSTQAEDGSWTNIYGPAVTGLALTALLDQPNIDLTDPVIQNAVSYILSNVQESGAISAGMLDNYNTAICVSALTRLPKNDELQAVIDNGLAYLGEIQNQVGSTTNVVDDNGNVTQAVMQDENHPDFGGSGYGRHGRPDGSNTQFLLQAFQDAGINAKSNETVQNALAFTLSLQAHEENTDISLDIFDKDSYGAFIYARSVNRDLPGVPQSQANPDLSDAAIANPRPYLLGEERVTNLRGYGSMTYAGFRAMLYAGLSMEDPRVQSAYEWILNNYTLDANPGMPVTENNTHLHGLYYYYVTFSRGLNATGQVTLTLPDGTEVDWQNDIAAELASRQLENGSWINEADRWSEGDANLVTAYSLIALNNARGLE